jgi:hypothetical protein
MVRRLAALLPFVQGGSEHGLEPVARERCLVEEQHSGCAVPLLVQGGRLERAVPELSLFAKAAVESRLPASHLWEAGRL